MSRLRSLIARFPGQRDRRGRRPDTPRRGFALIELMTVLLVAGSVSRIAAPNVAVMLHRARAADILGDVRVIGLAAVEYNSANRSWPETGEPGEVPGELESYLPEGFTFQSEDHTLTWERWELPDGLPGHPETGLLVGITVTISDEAVGAALLEMAGPRRVHLTVGNQYTFIIAGDR